MVTRSPDSNNVTSSAVGTALPKFAIRGMLKTFGLHGVVLDVDSVSKDTLGGHLMISITQLGAKTAQDAGLGLSWKENVVIILVLLTVLGLVLQVNELVQVETYLRSEGVLVRYWYPIDMLERPPAGYRRTATNGLVTLDNTNIQIHR